MKLTQLSSYILPNYEENSNNEEIVQTGYKSADIPDTQEKMVNKYLTFEHENAQPATIILKQNIIDDNEKENDGANLKEKEKNCLNN
uniref:Uncharacterized protein n=1 Tax=Romanomermis culicivorax TaxID=13658 RepID=A0A915KWJ6_ROMCU